MGEGSVCRDWMKVRASDSRLLGKVSMAWRSCSLRGIGFVPMGGCFLF